MKIGNYDASKKLCLQFTTGSERSSIVGIKIIYIKNGVKLRVENVT
jgi:hypothetical protein